MSVSISSEVMRETSEWCRLWWSDAADSASPRILLIGDSITAGYSKTVIDRLKDRAHVDYLATSRCLNDPALMKELTYMLGEYRYQVIHLNNGLHGWHLGLDAYGEHLARVVAFISDHCPASRLIWASSTPVTCENHPEKLHPEKNPTIVQRNLMAADVMTRLGISINDLYRIVEHRPDIRVADGLHYELAGQILLGDAVADQLLAALD